jgi:XTP/dITP diphosphohydrolase
MELVLASNNPHKVAEVRRILHGIAVRTPAELGVQFSFDETGSSYDENALGKARHLYRLVGVPTLADDSGLTVAALGGAPGIRSARFAPPGTQLDDAGRCAYLLSLMGSAGDRSAAFICCLALILDAHRLLLVQEAVSGEITAEARGTQGFGYDPVFLLPRFGRTMAELSGIEKDRVSHRGRALRRARRLLEAAP